MVTLRDLALACGCSVTSASRAMKNHKTISKNLRERVHNAALELGYIPNSIAGSMRTGTTNTIAMIMPETMNPYFSIITNIIAKYAAQNGYTTLIITTGSVTERELNAVHEALRKKVDGVLLCPFQETPDAIEILQRTNVPFVLVGRDFTDMALDCVRPDDRQGVYLTTRHMLENGRRRFLMLNSYEFISSSTYREAGFKQALSEFDISVAPGDIHYIPTDKGCCTQLINEVFAEGQPYDAISCYCDVLAYEAFYALKLLGIHCPRDIAITGVDDLHSHIIFPIKVTSAGYDIAGVAHKAIDLLFEKIDHKKKQGAEEAGQWQPRMIMFNQYLSVGETT
jgi:Transcriptional regulators